MTDSFEPNGASDQAPPPHDAAPVDPAHRHSKITFRDKPSEQFVREALKETVVTDTRGRRIRLARPPRLAHYKLLQVLGGELAANTAYVNQVAPLLYVSAIDGDPVFFPAKAIEIDALIQRLDYDGVDAVLMGVVDHFVNARSEADRDEIKN